MRRVKESHAMPILRVTAAMTVAAAVAFAQPAAQPATARPDADLLLVNGRIYTLDPANAWAEAIAISGSRIAAVGTTDAIRRLAAPGARVIDLRGAFALPGFNDAHVHVDSTGSLLVGANLLDVHEPKAARVSGAPRAASSRLGSGCARRSTTACTSPRSGSRADWATTGSASSATRRGSTPSWASRSAADN
jgi:cytosine/adenosine deaminase-related metal-dependent hydrolase